MQRKENVFIFSKNGYILVSINIGSKLTSYLTELFMLILAVCSFKVQALIYFQFCFESIDVIGEVNQSDCK